MSRTMVIPLSGEMQDCNWFDWVAVSVHRPTPAISRDDVRDVLKGVKLFDPRYDPDENGDIDLDEIKKGITDAFIDAGFTVTFIDVGKLEWLDVDIV